MQMLKLSGNNKYSQLGEKSNNKGVNGSLSIYPPINSHLDISSIAAYSTYWYHTVVITSNGEAYAAGDNSECQIIGSLPQRKLSKFTKFDIKDNEHHAWYPLSAVCGANYTLYLVSTTKKSDQTLLAYSHKYIKTEFPLFLNIGHSTPVSIFGGYSNAAAIDSDGNIIFIPESIVESPTTQIKAIHLPDGEKTVSIACCNEFIVAVGSSGRVFVSKTGQSNDEEDEEDENENLNDDGSIKLNFSVVKELEGIKIVDVCGTSFHCFAISDDGRVFGRGSNETGELGIGEAAPEFGQFTQIKTLSEYKIVAAYASDHSLFQTDDGRILACGSNRCGELIGSQPTKMCFYSPVETGVDRGATFCVAGWEISAVFIGCDPLRSPNRRIQTEKVNADEITENEKPSQPSLNSQNDKVTQKVDSNSNDSVDNSNDVSQEKNVVDEKVTSPQPSDNPLKSENDTVQQKVDSNDVIDEKVTPSKPSDNSLNSENDIVQQKVEPISVLDEKVTQETFSSPQEENIQLKAEISRLKKEIDQLRSETELQSTPKSAKSPLIDDSDENNFFTNEGQIGESSTSILYKMVDKRTKTPVCKKVLKLRIDQMAVKDGQRVFDEFQVMLATTHPCICEVTGIKSDKTALFLEFVEYSLEDVLKKSITNTLKTRIVLDIAHAMNFLNKRGMMHRNLKAENVMIDAFFETKIVDFGFVRFCESAINDFRFVDDLLESKSKGLVYLSPEMASKNEYDFKSDVFSFGIVLYFIFVGKVPNQSLKDKLDGKSVELPSPSKSISLFCIKLIEMCLQYSPSNRPSFEEILFLLRKNSYGLADDVDPSIVAKRDKELDLFK